MESHNIAVKAVVCSWNMGKCFMAVIELDKDGYWWRCLGCHIQAPPKPSWREKKRPSSST